MLEDCLTTAFQVPEILMRHTKELPFLIFCLYKINS